MILVQLACAVSVALAAVVCLYHVFLAVAALCARPASAAGETTASHSFAIVIPAHNEEKGIELALRSCASLDYDREKYTVYVVADNCEDRTAQIATRSGAVCLVRRDEENRGKGHALEWALPQVLAQGCDAVVVIDADCLIDAHALRAFDRRLAAGDRVLQANDAVANPDENGISYVLALANALENDLFYAPKSNLGWAVFLRGTGMVFHREVLEAHPWRAASIVEDAEYAARLLEEGIRVRFVPNVRVVSDFPADREQLAVQRSRWIGGGVCVGCAQGLRLLWSGVTKRRFLLVDAGWTTLIASRPMVIAQLLLSILLGLLWHGLSPDLWSRTVLFLCVGIVAAYALYAAAGVVLLGITFRRARLLLQFPLVILRYLLIAARTLLAAPPTAWVRTPRA